MNIGQRIRKFRKQQHRTLEAVAGQAGITKSMLSKVETGATMPAVATLSRVAAALGVPVATLIDESDQAATVYTAAANTKKAPPVRTTKGYSFFAFASRRVGKTMQPYLFTARRRDVKPEPLSHAGEEFIYVLEGEMKYRVGAIEYTLRPGDSLYFDAEDEHDFQPITADVKYLGMFVERGQNPR